MKRGRLGACLAAALVAAALQAALIVPPASAATDASPRVINGRDPLPEELSALVLVHSGGLLCSGTLVDVQHVVTAAHCVSNADAITRSPSAIRVGWSNTRDLPAAVHSVTSVYVADYSGAPDHFNDIAVLRLSRPIAGATPIPLASVGESRRLLAEGKSVRSSGYGATTPAGGASPVAYVGDLKAVPDSACGWNSGTYTFEGVTFYSPWIYGVRVDARTALCAIGVVPGSDQLIDTCSGDSGGPLVGGTGSRARLVGLASMGVGCAGYDGAKALDRKVSGVYTRIAAYLDWLTGLGIETIPEAPVLTATPVGADGIAISFAAVRTASLREFHAFVPGKRSAARCVISVSDETCIITGLKPGESYPIVGFSRGVAFESPRSTVVVATAGVPTARPGKPRISDIMETPGGRLAILVERVDAAAWTRTLVICAGAERRHRAHVVDGKAVLSLPVEQEYRCYAKSTNPQGGTRSKPIRVTL